MFMAFYANSYRFTMTTGTTTNGNQYSDPVTQLSVNKKVLIRIKMSGTKRTT